jgi:membrane protein
MFENLFNANDIAVILYCLLAMTVTLSMFKILLMVTNGFNRSGNKIDINLNVLLPVFLILSLIVSLFTIGYVYLGYSISNSQLIVVIVTFLFLHKVTGINDDNREESFHDNIYVYLFVPIKLLTIAVIHFLTLGLFRATMIEYKMTHDYIAEIRLNDGDPFNVFYNELLNNLGDLMYTFCLIRIIDPKFKEDPFGALMFYPGVLYLYVLLPIKIVTIAILNICTFGMSTAIKCECEIITNWIVYTHLNNSVSNFLIKLCNGFTYCMLPLANSTSVIIGQRDEILSLYNEVKVLPENTIGKPKNLIEHGSLMQEYRNKFN